MVKWTDTPVKCIIASMMASSDLAALHHLLYNSLSSQEALRREAEASLEQASKQPGFGMVLLQVVTSEGDLATRQAAAVYFKNLINKRYDPYEEGKVAALGEEEKTHLRACIVSAVVSCVPTVRPQLLAAAEKMIRADFPKKWPSLLEELYPIIASGQAERALSGLAIFHELVSWQGGSAQEDVRDIVQGKFFPVLLGLVQAHVQTASEAHAEAMAIVKAVVKCFYAAIQYRFSTHLLLGEAFSAWCTVLTQVVTCSVPPSMGQLTSEEAAAHPFWKMKKWALRVHNKIFQRYGCAKLDTFNNADNMAFAKFYMEKVALPVLAVYLQQVETNVAGRNPFPERIFCLICDFLESCIRHKRTWAVLEPHAMEILSRFCFPRACFSSEDAEMWEEDPEEYVRMRFDPFEEIYSATSSAVSFTLDLVKCRKKSMFIPVLQFINSLLESPSEEQTAVRHKDGALFLLGSMARVLLASNFSDQIAMVLTSFVLPLLSSPHGFLRMRACWTLEQFDDVEMAPEVTVATLHAVLKCLCDSQLPVRVAGAGALGSLLDKEPVQQALPPQLGQVMEALLVLANDIQIDSIAFVLEQMVQMFSEHLAPYAVQLCTQLRDTVARNLEGYSNVLDVDVEDDAFGQGTDRMMAVVGMFKAIETLVDSMGKTPELLGALEEVVLPLLAMVFDRRIVDVYEEAFELVDSISFARKTVSPGLWALFPYLHRVFIEVGADYIQDMHTCLDNYISYGAAVLLADEKLLPSFVEIIKTTMTDEMYSPHDRVYGCKLMESMMLNCRGHIDALIPMFLEFLLPVISATGKDEFGLPVVIPHLQVFLNALYYNAPLALSALESLGATAGFFTLWFNRYTKFTRVHDKRLIIVSLVSLMAIPFEALPFFVRENYRFILPVFLFAVQTLPKALEERKRLQEEDDVSDSDFEGSFDEADYDEINDDADGEEEAAISAATHPTYADANVTDDDSDDDFDDELEEELFFETPLDSLDMALVIQESLCMLAKGQPQVFMAATQSLTSEQSTMINSILNP